MDERQDNQHTRFDLKKRKSLGDHDDDDFAIGSTMNIFQCNSKCNKIDRSISKWHSLQNVYPVKMLVNNNGSI